MMTEGLFDERFRMEKIEHKQHNLMMLKDLIDWEIFRADLETLRDKPRKSNAGAKGYDLMLLFKMLLLKTLYNLSYDQIEFQVLDRLSFMRFLDLNLGSDVPDGSTLWLFEEALKKAGLERKLFDTFNAFLAEQGYEAQRGQIVDANIVKSRRQHNRQEEREAIKRGERVEGWSDAKRRQKDVEATFTRKGNDVFFGYKNHVQADAQHKLIRDYGVTTAKTHDSNVFLELLDPDNPDRRVWADSAYRSAPALARLAELGYEAHLQEQGHRNHPLTEEQRKRNTVRAHIRARVEHVFGAATNWTRDLVLRTIGIGRARCTIGLKNLVYNMDRYRVLESRLY